MIEDYKTLFSIWLLISATTFSLVGALVYRDFFAFQSFIFLILIWIMIIYEVTHPTVIRYGVSTAVESLDDEDKEVFE